MNFRSTDPDSIIAAFNRTVILENPDMVTAAVKDDKQATFDEAEMQASYTCKDVEAAAEKAEAGGDTSGSEALRVAAAAAKKACDAAKEVVAAKQTELDEAQTELDKKLGINNDGIIKAQRIIKKLQESEAAQAKSSKLESNTDSVPYGRFHTNIPLPDADFYDPFTMECAESTSRISMEHPIMTKYMLPNLEQPADLPDI